MRYFTVGLLALLILVTACGTPIGTPVVTGQTATSEPVGGEASPRANDNSFSRANSRALSSAGERPARHAGCL